MIATQHITFPIQNLLIMANPKTRARQTVLPLFTQVETNLRQRIIDNQLSPGSKLPSEAELEVEFGVSRITVRQALSALHASGLIEKINGKGSFVTRPTDTPDLGSLTGFYEHMRSRGYLAHGRTLSVRKIAATAAAAEALKIPVGSPLTAVTALRMVNDKPLAIGITYGPSELMQALLREDIEINDMMTLLESRLGYRLKTTHIEASAVPAGIVRARHLGISAQSPVLRIRFTPHDVSDQPVSYSEMYFRGDGFSYKAVVKR